MLAENLQRLGQNQALSQYEVIFLNGIPFGTNTTGEEVKLRQRNNFQIPEEPIGTIDWFYRGVKVTDLIGVDETTKEIQLIFVVDQRWRIYKDFKLWKNATYDSKTGTLGDRDVVSTEILVNALGADDAIYNTWHFKGVRVQNLALDEFAHDSTEYALITVTCLYDYWV